ncbi:MAG: nucleotidyltransferase domain-containing protein [Coriobacteriales bacterium]|nr:nucleotidyltransferase domain-containing protein [Coriobacteriales bacterium]
MHSIPEISKIVSPVARSYGIDRLSVFGSYARGEATSDSDIDFRIVEDGSLRGLIKLAGFCRELEASLGTPVDVLTNDAVDDGFLRRIKDEEVIVYG